mgnify:CR=1 FL=1
MKKIILTIKENWKDPVWSKVIAAGIITIITSVLTALYAFIKMLYSKISFEESFQSILSFINEDFTIKIWGSIALLIFYAILIFKPTSNLIQEILFKIRNPKIKEKKCEKPKLKNATEHSTSLFYQRMASAFPGVRDVKWFTDTKEATSRLEILLQNPLRFKSDSNELESDPIWWFRGVSAMHIGNFEKTGRRKVLMNFDQLKIKKIAAYHGEAYYKDFVYVEVEGEKQTGLYDHKPENLQSQIDSRGYSYEEYGLIKNWLGWKTPIRREDYDDGATVIRGKVKKTLNAELRVRYLSKYNFIIAAKGSPYNSNKFNRLSKDYLDKMLKNEIEPNEFFNFLKKFQKYEQ